MELAEIVGAGEPKEAGGSGTALSGCSLLCVSNFPGDEGYAWSHFQRLFEGVGGRLRSRGIRTLVAYPSSPPEMSARPVEPLELDVEFSSVRSVARACRLIREQEVRGLFSFDRPAWHPAFSAFRAAGVKHIVVYDQTSGTRTAPGRVKGFLKRLRHRVPGTLADQVVAVSDFVARRKLTTDLVPPERITRVWNGLPVPDLGDSAGERLRQIFDIESDRRVILSACRAAEYKGVQHLLRAFDIALRSGEITDPPPALVYFGDGPYMDTLENVRAELVTRSHIHFGGYRVDAADLMGDADLCVVPSTWQEAFGLAVLEPMLRATPVIASDVGGIPEILVHGETGELVPPADVPKLAEALVRMLERPKYRDELGTAARERAASHFSLERQLDQLTDVIAAGFCSDE